jgi:chemotaxis protein methyltransferase CheR
MITDQQPIAVRVEADAGSVDSSKAVSLGLIVTELVINAIKYAFPADKAGAEVVITYKVGKSGWKLIISDNGDGKTADAVPKTEGGLGTTIVKALAQQLGASVETESTSKGLKVSITDTASATGLPRAA